MQVRVDEIKVKHRIRRDLGDITQLAESIKAHGLMNPIVINEKRELIAGERRLESVKLLGWQTVDVRVVYTKDEAEKIQLEIDENLYRRPLTAGELSSGLSRVDRLRNPGFLLRIWLAVKRFFSSLFSKSKR